MYGGECGVERLMSCVMVAVKLSVVLTVLSSEVNCVSIWSGGVVLQALDDVVEVSCCTVANGAFSVASNATVAFSCCL